MRAPGMGDTWVGNVRWGKRKMLSEPCGADAAAVRGRGSPVPGGLGGTLPTRGNRRFPQEQRISTDSGGTPGSGFGTGKRNVRMPRDFSQSSFEKRAASKKGEWFFYEICTLYIHAPLFSVGHFVYNFKCAYRLYTAKKLSVPHIGTDVSHPKGCPYRNGLKSNTNNLPSGTI